MNEENLEKNTIEDHPERPILVVGATGYVGDGWFPCWCSGATGSVPWASP